MDTCLPPFRRWRRPLKRSLLFLALALPLSGCDFGDNTPNSSMPPPPTTVLATQTTKPTDAPPFQPTQPIHPSIPAPLPTGASTSANARDMNQAWGANLPIARVPLLVDDQHAFILNAVTPDARFLVGSVVTRNADEHGGTEPGKAVLLDVQSHQATEMHVFPRKDTQMGPASADDEWVVWSEAAQEPGFFADWVIYSYNRKTHSVKQVAAAPREKNGELITGGPLVFPKVDHGIVVWSQIPPASIDNVHVLVMSADLVTGKVSTLTDLGQQPTISWPYVAWEGPRPDTPQTLTRTQETCIYLLNLETNVTKPLKSTHNTSYFALYKGAVVWISEHGDQIILTDVDESKSQVIAEPGEAAGGPLQYPSIGDRLVTWVSYTRTEVWDRTEQRLVYVVNPYGLQGNSIANGNAYAWQSGGSPEQAAESQGDMGIMGITLNILDSSQLPVR